MKKYFKTLLIAAMGIFALSSCEDVPAPYDVPGSGDGGSEEIATSKENPYSVAEAQGASGSNYVRGYIVGYVDGTSLESGVRFEVPTEAQTEILLADNPDEVDPSKVYPVQLPAGDIRNALELSAHPELLKQEVLLFGSIERYFNVPGMKSTSWARLGDKEYGKDPEAEEVPGAEPTGDGTLESPFNVAAAVKYTTALGADVESDKAVYVKGKVKTISTTQSTIDTYGNHTFTMVDIMESSETFMAFQVLAPGNVKFTSLDQIKVGDEVVVYGKVVNYKGNTPETVGKGQAYVYSINGSTEGGGEEGGGEEGGDEPEPGDVTAISIADFLSKADTQTTYQLTGTVQNIKNETYGNFDLVDATGSIYIYGLLDLDGNTKNFASLGIAAGDEVTLTGVYSEFNGSPQIKNAQFVSVKKGEGGDEGGEEGGEEGGGDTPVEPVEGFTFTSSQVFSSGLNGATLATNGYGQQAIANESTWYGFSIDGVEFVGCRICIAPSNNGGGLQMQGNDSDAAKQGFITNVTPFAPIKTIQIVCRTVNTSKYDPSFHLYAGTETHPVDNAIEGTSAKVAADATFNEFTYTFDLSAGDYTHFTIANDLAGALYIDKVVVATK